LPELHRQVAALQAAAASRKIMWEGASDAIATANLQSRVEELAKAAGVSIGSSEALPIEAGDGYRRIGLRLVGSGEYPKIVGLLGNIETLAPPLIVGEAQIRAAPRATIASAEKALDVSFTVYGLRSAETPMDTGR
jgi:general secretion pathway protein M